MPALQNMNVGFIDAPNLNRRIVESSVGLRGYGPSAKGTSSHKAILQKNDGRSNRQASGTGVVLAEGFSMLKSASAGYTRNWGENLHKVSMWDFVQITVVVTRVQGLGSTIWSFGSRLQSVLLLAGCESVGASAP
ncbi:unnamed protein product [Prunus armeniaca]